MSGATIADVSQYSLFGQEGDGEEFKGDEDDDTRQLKCLERIDGGLKPGARITIIGRVLPEAERFDVDLCEKARGDNKILHFNPRFGYEESEYNVIVMNTLVGPREHNNWGDEERGSYDFTFEREQVFKLVIRCEKTRFHFEAHEEHLTEFEYRNEGPLTSGKYLRILGGVEVIHVDIRN